MLPAMKSALRKTDKPDLRQTPSRCSAFMRALPENAAYAPLMLKKCYAPQALRPLLPPCQKGERC